MLFLSSPETTANVCTRHVFFCTAFWVQGTGNSGRCSAQPCVSASDLESAQTRYSPSTCELFPRCRSSYHFSSHISHSAFCFDKPACLATTESRSMTRRNRRLFAAVPELDLTTDRDTPSPGAGPGLLGDGRRRLLRGSWGPALHGCGIALPKMSAADNQMTRCNTAPRASEFRAHPFQANTTTTNTTTSNNRPWSKSSTRGVRCQNGQCYYLRKLRVVAGPVPPET